MTSETPPQTVTKEQFELNAKLESIFMPQAHKSRNEAFKRDATSGAKPEDVALRFVHYTSAEAALSIIKAKRIWMRNAMCMADYREVQHGYDILKRFFSTPEKRGRFIEALDSAVQGAALEAINAFDQQWQAIRLDTYVTSVSEHDRGEDLHGRLSMWRAFGGNTARVAVVFRIPWFSGASLALNILFSPVAYVSEQQVHGLMDEVFANVRANQEFLRSCGRQVVIDWVFTMLLAGVTCSKHEGFHEEREWRAIYQPTRRQSPLMSQSTEVINGVPQQICKLPLDQSSSRAVMDLEFSTIFDRLIIGPSQYPWPMFESFAQALATCGVADAAKRVCISGIPIRT
jgi:hypothetical protein